MRRNPDFAIAAIAALLSLALLVGKLTGGAIGWLAVAAPIVAVGSVFFGIVLWMSAREACYRLRLARRRRRMQRNERI